MQSHAKCLKSSLLHSGLKLLFMTVILIKTMNENTHTTDLNLKNGKNRKKQVV